MTFSLQDKKNELATARKWGISVITAIFGVTLFVYEVKRLWPFKLYDYPYLLVLLTCGVLIFIWIWATQKELDLIFAWLDPEGYSPPTGFKETAIILSLSLFLAMLMVSAKNIICFGSIFLIYSITVCYAVKHLNSHMKLAIDMSRNRYTKLFDNSKKQQSEIYIDAINVIENYFIVRPHTKRHIAIIILCFIPIEFSIYAKIYSIEFLNALSYFFYFCIIAISEFYIGMWRETRDDDLRPIEASMREVCKEQKNRA